ncbi:Major Facilitator Superfamily protein [Pseudomonas antarctica]|uniref:Major Facilitator Superfamily protein n=1 Tax=Pseudomonas antarctica TaxID=219572 RepID=A0A1H0CBX8_9PSED|nr:MFS transporter [Pseudomonas antarctica]KAF2406922.1 multidrug resistance protein Stp [Pseudomonas antarctica]SDN55369.1 Major Facilitator Superfamily protein [Pseudomonas antarctica]
MNTATHSPNGRHAILAAICLAALVLPMSFTGGAVATPFIGEAFAALPTQLAWITNAFMLSFGSLLMAAGTLADLYGRKRLFLWGMALFTAISLLLAMAPGILWLDLLRAVQGVAAAIALASGCAALAQEFDGHARTRAFSLLGTTFGAGLAFGPLLSGLLIEQWGSRAIFLATALLAGLSLLFATPTMRESRDPHALRLDLAGVLTFSAMLVALTTAVILAPEQGWASATTHYLLGTAAVFLLTFIFVEHRASQPMLDLRLFRFPRFIGVQVLPIGTCYCYIVLIVLLPLRFIGVEGASAFDAGLMMLALSAPMLVVPILAATLTRWLPAGALCAIGLLIAATGLYGLSLAKVGQPLQTVTAMLIIGVGTGLPWGLMDGLAISVVPKERAGMAAGIFNTTRVASEGVALAITVAVLSTLVTHHLPARTVQEGAAVAQQLVMGDARHASANIPLDVLRMAYIAGFNTLLQWLAWLTVLTAAMVFVFLGRRDIAPMPTSPTIAS